MKILANLPLVKKTDSNLPFGKTIQDENDTQQGTPIVADLMQDLFSNFYRLLEIANITPTNAFDSDSTQYQIIDALKKLPNSMNDIERILTLNDAGDTWAVDLDLTILPNKYIFLARASDDYDIAETYDFKGSGDDTYSFTSEYFKTGNLLLIVIDTGTVRSYTISKSLQNVLDTNPIATFKRVGVAETAIFQEIINEGFQFYSHRSFQDENRQAVESLETGASYRYANYIEDSVYQTQHQDIVSTIDEASGSMNRIKYLFKEIYTNGHTGSIQIQVPTPKTGASGVIVEIEFPYKEVSGTYRIATKDEIGVPSSQTQTQRSTATSGTENINNVNRNIVYIHEAGATATLTINLPTIPVGNQTVTIMSVGGIVGLTLSTALGTIVGTITALTALQSVKFIWLESQSKWYKIN